MMQRFRYSCVALLAVLCAVASVFAAEDGLRTWPLLPRPISKADSAVVSFTHAELLFPAGHQRFDSLYALFDQLTEVDAPSVRILHIGGSHVQADCFTGRMRANLQALTPGQYVHRGLVFPFSVLGTNGPRDYACSSTGKWLRTKNVDRTPSHSLGLAGASLTSADLASTISYQGLQPFRHLTVLGHSEVDSALVAPLVIVDGDTLRAHPSSSAGRYEFLMQAPSTHFTLALSGDSCGQFTHRGVLTDTQHPGILYTSSGINGAAVPSWLRCTEFERELGIIAPHLVIFAIGINDANVQNFSPETFKANYRELIGRIQRCNPSCAFLFVVNNDCYLRVGRRRSHNPNTAKVETAFIELAQEYHGAVWNLYQLMGGFGSSNRWVKAGLMKSDHIHFTPRGYELLGDLLYNALIRDYQRKLSPSASGIGSFPEIPEPAITPPL